MEPNAEAQTIKETLTPLIIPAKCQQYGFKFEFDIFKYSIHEYNPRNVANVNYKVR